MAPASFLSSGYHSGAIVSHRFSTRPALHAGSFRLKCRAAADGESAESAQALTADSAPAGPKKTIRRVKKAEAEADPNLELKPLKSVEGVVRIDGGSRLSLGQLALLVAGDAASLILFAYIGRATHVSTAVDLELLKTALPFLTGWLVSGLVFGDYSPSRPLPQGLSSVAGSTAKTWAVGVPVGIAIRSLIKGQPPQVPFLVVSLVSTAVILTGWRYAYFNLVAKDAAGGPEAPDKKGNVFEFFELLTTLVRRW